MADYTYETYLEDHGSDDHDDEDGCRGCDLPLELFSTRIKVLGEILCPDCADTCSQCGEWISDVDTTKLNHDIAGPMVTVHTSTGRVSGHAFCMAARHLGDSIDFIDWTRDEIAEAVMGPLAKV